MPISLFPNAQAFQAPESGTVVVIGNFDGVHVGHVAVLRRALEISEARGLAPVVLTFNPHPAEVLGHKKLPQLTTLEFKAELIAQVSGAISIVAEPFTLELAAKSPSEFARELLVQKLEARHVMVGENFAFGKQRSGNFKDLRALGEELGFSAEALPLIGDANGPYSSSRVRQALDLRSLTEVTVVLGRPHALSGLVVHGQGRARTLGFPTANLAQVSEALPRYGVFAVLVDQLTALGPKRLGGGVANIGERPTLGAGFSVEAHIFDFHQDLYGERLRLHLVERLRDEHKFGSADELKAQIERDLAAGREILALPRPR